MSPGLGSRAHKGLLEELCHAWAAGCRASEVEELRGVRKLLRVVEKWLRTELTESRAAEAADPARRAARPGAALPAAKAPLMPTKHMMFFRG